MADSNAIDKIMVLPGSGKFTSELRQLLLFIMEQLSKELPMLQVDSDYFFLGLLNQKRSVAYKLLDDNLTESTMENIEKSFYEYISSKALAAVKPNRTLSFASSFEEVFKKLNETSLKEASNPEAEKTVISSVNVLAQILSTGSNKVQKVLKVVGITPAILIAKYKSLLAELSSRESQIKEGLVEMLSDEQMKSRGGEPLDKETDTPGESGTTETSGTTDGLDNLLTEAISISTNDGAKKSKKGFRSGFVSQFCTNINDLVDRGKIDAIIGREKEIDEIIRVLGRKKKNNAILVGGEGVGKTVIGESIAYRIVNNDVPEFLQDKVLVSLDMTGLMAGTTLRGMFEERVKGVLDELKKNGNYILFIDNIGSVFSEGKDEYNFSAMMSKALESGDVQVIGTADFTSFRKVFDKNPSLSRRFYKIIVEAPSVEDSKEILFGLKKSYERFHNVSYTDGAINACVDLAVTYLPEKNLPDSAIDLMDEVGSFRGRLYDDQTMKANKEKMAEIEKEIKKLKKADERTRDYEKIDKLTVDLIEANREYSEKAAEFRKTKKKNPVVIDVTDIFDIVSRKTGIPVNELSSEEKRNLSGINERLKKEIIGQDEQIDIICKALKRNRVGLRNRGTMFSALIIGKTGIGKTLIAKKLAKEIFGDEKKLIRFDMSEYTDKTAVNKLIGSNPGYIGYDEGGRLTEAIKNKKHCVLLLDEIEKADPEIYNIFLQVLDEGFLTDNSGMKVDFKNVIVIFTSNVGAKAVSDFGKGIGFNENEGENTKRIFLKQLKGRFPPEFLNRLDKVIYFNSLTEDNMKSIIGIELEKTRGKIENIGYKVKFGSNVVDHILKTVMEEKEFGARPVIRAIEDEIEDMIADEILNETFEKGHVFEVVEANGKLQLL